MSRSSRPSAPPLEASWVSVRHLQRLATSGTTLGLGMDDLLSQAGLRPEQLRHPDGMVPLAAVETLLSALQHQDGELPLGLVGANDIQPATLGALGHLLQACTTFGDMLEVIMRYRGTLSNIGHLWISHAPGLLTLHWDCLAGSPLFRRLASEYVLGSVAVMTRLLVASQTAQAGAQAGAYSGAPPTGHPSALGQPVSVQFRHPKPVQAERARAYFDFFACPVHFDQDTVAISFPATLLSMRLPFGDTVLKGLLEQHARHLLDQRQSQSTVLDDVRRLTRALLQQGQASKEAVAQQLGMSPRSLHRHLQAANTSYREVVDTLRLEQACQHLRDSTASMADLADQLGFCSRQAFMRWFRQQQGITPSQYRQRVRGERAAT
jgi:AraC-like DNA-binding protein